MYLKTKDRNWKLEKDAFVPKCSGNLFIKL